MQSSGMWTSTPSSSASRAPHGSSESFGSGPFFGRPRWLARMTRAPRSIACLIVGSASTMRASSVMTCLPFDSSSGTLKSTRMKRRLFSISSSRIGVMRSSVVMRDPRGRRSQFRADELSELDHAVREAPLVVVPAEDLREVLALNLRDGGVEDRRVRIADEVARDERLVAVKEDALEGAVRRALHRRVDRVLRERLLRLEREVDEADVHRGDADRLTVELACE